MTIRLALIAGMLAALFCVTVEAQTYKAFPGETMNTKTLATQARVEELYEAGEYDRALLIYEKELAPLGDKYAQHVRARRAAGQNRCAGLVQDRGRAR